MLAFCIVNVNDLHYNMSVFLRVGGKMTNKRGLTLIEVVVAMAVFMILVTMY